MNLKLALFVAADAVVVLLVLFFVFGRGSHDSSAPVASTPTAAVRPEARQEFLNAYRQAHENGDITAAMQLVCPDGVSGDTLESLRASMQDDFQLPLDGVAIVPLADDDPLEYTLGGVRYVPNLMPIGKLRIRLGGDANVTPTTTYLVGVKNGRYLIATSKPAN